MRALVAAVALAVVASSCAGRADGETSDDILLAGTVFWGPSPDSRTVDHAYVRIVDANKVRRCFVTSCDGRFVVRRGDFPAFSFPASVSVERVDDPEADPSHQSTLVLRRMSSRIGRAGPCESCHAPGRATSASAGQIAMFEDDASADRVIRPSGSCVAGPAPLALACPEDRALAQSAGTQGAALEIDPRDVHTLFARRCGSLDCHGSTSRALRIFSREGLRLGDAVTGREPTTDAEIQATFDSVIAIDSAVVIARARGVDHAIGPLVFVGDPGYQCLAAWLGVERDPSGPQSTTSISDGEACRHAAAMP